MILNKREIEFRAKSKDTDSWVYGYYVQYGNKTELTGIIFEKGKSISELFCLVRSETVGQLLFTNDNGIKIYTGDILKGTETYENSTEYPLYSVGWDGNKLGYELITLNGAINPPFNWIRSLEKFGNIFDNPEVIKVWLKNSKANTGGYPTSLLLK